MRFSKEEVRNALLQLVPELYETKAIETALKRMKDVEKSKAHAYIVDLGKAVQKYGESELTADDQAKIKLIDAEIAKYQGEISKIGDRIAKSQQNALAKAVESNDFGKIAEITTNIAKKQHDQSQKQLEAIRTCKKQQLGIQNKRILAAQASLDADWSISASSDENGSGTAAYSFDGQRFHVKSTRKSLDYSADWLYDVETRRIWVKANGAGWKPEMSDGNWHFAGFMIDTSSLPQKSRVNTRTRLCRANYTWITLSQVEKPGSDEELLEMTRKLNLRIENGNLSEQYSGGSEYCLRLVERINPEEKDVGHQVLRQEYDDPGWDDLELHRLLVDEQISAEMADNGQETAESDADVAKAA